MTPGGERSGAGGRTCLARPGGKGLGGNCLGGLVSVWVGLAWARYFALSLPTAAAAAAAGEAPVARAGFFPRLRGVLGVAAWPAVAVARPAGAAVATPRVPSSLSSAGVAAAGEAPVARAGSVPRFRGVLGVAAWPAEAVARPAGVAAATPRAPSSLSFAHSTALHTARRRAAAHHQSHLLPRINAGPGTITEATHKSTLNLLARKLRPKMALEDTLWIYYGEGRTARVADLRNIIPRHIQRAVGPFTVYAVPHPITAPCTHCNPRCALPCAGALQQPLPTPTYRGGIYLGTVPGDPHPYLLPAADRHHAIPLHLVEHLAVGPSPSRKRPPHTTSDGRPPDEPTHATPGPKRAIALLTLKAEAAIPRDLEGENHLMVEGLTEHVLIAAMYATASASRLWEDRPSPPLAQAAQDTPDTGPTAEDIHQILNMRAPPKTHPAVRPIQLVSWDAMDAPPTTTEVHILKHRHTWWTVEWDDHGKVRRATAHAPDGEVPPPPRGGGRLRLAARIPHAPEAAWEALHYALYWAQGAPEGPLPPERTPAWTRHATRYTAHMRRHGAGTGHRLLTWPTDPPDALQEAEEVLGLMTKQVF